MHIIFSLYSLGRSFSTYLQTHLAPTDSSGDWRPFTDDESSVASGVTFHFVKTSC